MRVPRVGLRSSSPTTRRPTRSSWPTPTQPTNNAFIARWLDRKTGRCPGAHPDSTTGARVCDPQRGRWFGGMMKIYPTTGQIPELRPWTKAQRHEAWRAVLTDMHRSWKPWCGYMLCGMLVFVLLSSSVSGIERLIGKLLVGVVGGITIAQFQYAAAVPLMKEWLERVYPTNSPIAEQAAPY